VNTLKPFKTFLIQNSFRQILFFYAFQVQQKYIFHGDFSEPFKPA
jgi:hypothetical protein